MYLTSTSFETLLGKYSWGHDKLSVCSKGTKQLGQCRFDFYANEWPGDPEGGNRDKVTGNIRVSETCEG